jgi:hypothetical protein
MKNVVVDELEQYAEEMEDLLPLLARMLDDTLGSFVDFMQKKYPKANAVIGLTAFKIALMESAAKIQLTMAHSGIVDSFSEQQTEMMFSESARLAFKHFVETHGMTPPRRKAK